jgi:hypothetical protein
LFVDSYMHRDASHPKKLVFVSDVPRYLAVTVVVGFWPPLCGTFDGENGYTLLHSYV